MTALLPEGVFPLDSRQREQLKALEEGLTSEQAMWLAGYFTGLSQGGPATQAPPAAQQPPVVILYGSETGNCRTVAEQLAERCAREGIPYELHDLGQYRPRQLRKVTTLAVITATHGDGDPPEGTQPFFDYVKGERAPQLGELRYAVLALGDSSYEFFCEAGKRLDERLTELGATRLTDRVDCDIDFEEPAEQWVAAVLDQLERPPADAAGTRPAASIPVGNKTRHDRKHPLKTEVLQNLVLNDIGSEKQIRHVELDIADAGLTYQPGDALGILAHNDPAWVDSLLQRLGMDGDTVVTMAGNKCTLADALVGKLEITRITPRVLELWARYNSDDSLQRLLRDDHRDERLDVLASYQLPDLAQFWPVDGLTAQGLVDGLRPLQPRLYSIASSQTLLPDEVHLTVARVDYRVGDEQRLGVASHYLAGQLPGDGHVEVYVQENPRFRLPEDPDTPIIMIGPGTGVAPFRAFMQEREARGAKSPAWLFFGDQRQRLDFLYQIEWQQWLADGVLTRMDVAFSRDQRDKVYVQHRMREHAADLFDWLERGAIVYVCGDATNMARDVHDALIDAVAMVSGEDRARGEAYLDMLTTEGRYRRDVY